MMVQMQVFFVCVIIIRIKTLIHFIYWYFLVLAVDDIPYEWVDT